MSILTFISKHGLIDYYDTEGQLTEKSLGNAVVSLPSLSEEMFVNIQAQTLFGISMAPGLCTT